jgi:PIN domain nuclease of toxin-antitoxin system
MVRQLGQDDAAMNREGVLLDTCAILFSAKGDDISPLAKKAIDEASATGSLYISPVSAWEIGKLVAGRKLKLPVDPLKFFLSFVELSASRIASLTADIMVHSSFLPHFAHRDPMDCLLVASARTQNLTLVTRDRAILAYGAEGHVKTLAC